MIKKLRLECVEVFRSNLFYLYLLRQVPINSFFKFALSPEFTILSCTSTYLLRTRVSPPSLCQAPYICLSFPTGFYIHQQSSTRVCLPSICQASNNSLSFPNRLYIHSDIFYIPVYTRTRTCWYGTCRTEILRIIPNLSASRPCLGRGNHRTRTRRYVQNRDFTNNPKLVRQQAVPWTGQYRTWYSYSYVQNRDLN